MRRNTLFSILLLFSLAVSAQDISVKSFRLLQGDMTASSLEGKRTDQNGQVAALIKVVTRETGFVFEGGALGIVGTQQKAGEIWVWVPRGLRKITILHQQLGGLRDYVFPENIEEGHTYEMVLTTAAIQTVVKEEEIPQQYLSFQLSPANATLVVNDEPWEVDASGGAMRIVDFGTYTYRVQAPNHYADAGRVTVDDPDNTTHVTVTLVPDCAEVTLKVDADAEIWVNNEKKGIRTWTGTLYSGTYSIECKMPNHESGISTQTITADMNGQTIMLPAPKTMYGSLNVETTPGNVTVFIDGKETGKTPLTVNELIIGSHEIRLAREGCADLFETVTIVKGEQSHVNHTMPLGCSIQFFCNVPDARLIVDGITYGSVAEGCNLTQGMHTLKVTAQGYNEFSGSINVTKNKMQHCITRHTL